jgi:hypothetical protein
MIETKLLSWLQSFSSWYIILPLLIVLFRWNAHDVFRRRVAWYVIFNISFTGLTTLLDKLDVNNLFVFYLGSPIFLWVIFRIFEPLIGTYKIWNLIKWMVIGFALFVFIDMFWIENYITKFPNNVYPPQEVIVLFIVYYYLYIFSKEARQDFSSLWVTIGIGFSALITLIILLYFPFLGFKPNTLGDFIWNGLGSFSSIISYSFVSYGLYIAKPKLSSQ